MDFTEKTINVTSIYKGKVVDVRIEDVLLPNGKPAKREIIAHPGGVCVIAIKEDRKVLVVKQYRIAFRKVLLEVPAGKLEYGENPLECGIRELEEETGYTAKNVVHLGEYYPTPGYCEEKINIYMATDLTKTQQNLDEGEFLDIDEIPLDDLYNMVMDNEIHDAKTSIAILKAKAILDN